MLLTGSNVADSKSHSYLNIDQYIECLGKITSVPQIGGIFLISVINSIK